MSDNVINILKKELDKIIIKNLNSETFNEDYMFEVREPFGQGEYYLTKIEGSYDMSLQSLVYYIMYEKGIYKELFSNDEYEMLEETIREFPERIYLPKDDEMRDYIEEIENAIIGFVGNRLIRLNFKLESEFDDFIDPPLESCDDLENTDKESDEDVNNEFNDIFNKCFKFRDDI